MSSPRHPFSPLLLLVFAALAWPVHPAGADDADASTTDESTTEVKPGEAASTEPADEDEKGPAITLRYGFQKGRGLHYSVVQRSYIRTTKGELEDTTKSGTEIAKHLRVIHVEEDGTALLESTIDHARMAVQFDDAAPVQFDSRKDEDPPKQFRDLAAKVGKPLARLKVSSRGELISLVKLEGQPARARGPAKPRAADFRRDLDKSLPAKDKADRKRAAEEQKVLENILVEFPEKPLHVGDSWQQTFEVEVVVANNLTRMAKLQRTFTLASVDENGLATIRFEIAVLSIVRDPQISIQLLQRTPKGKILFDTKAGYIVSRSQSCSEHIFGPFGPGSEMVARSQRSERFVAPKKPGEKRDVAAKD